MSLRQATIVIEREGRDKGGVFVLREMPAEPAADWFLRAMQLLARSGADVPPHIMQLGAAGFVTIGIGTVLGGLGKAPWHEVKPLLAELLTCVVSYQAPNATQPMTNWSIIKTQILEAATILQLYEEVVSLSLGFSLSSRLWSFREQARQMMDALGPTTETSIEPSPSSLAPDSPA